MKKEFFVFAALILVLNILAVSVFAEDGVSGSTSGSDSTSIDSGKPVPTLFAANATREEIKTQRQEIRNETRVKIAEIRNDTKELREERRMLLNGTNLTKEDAEGLREQAKQDREALREENKQLIEDIKQLREIQREDIKDFEEKMKEQHGLFRFENKTLSIKELTLGQKELIAANINARTGLNLTADNITSDSAQLRAALSNGRFAEVKFMPDRASKVALERLQAKCDDSTNCTVELKEVGNGNETRAAYEVKTQKEARLFFIFKKKMDVNAQVDSETGQVIKVSKPWWSFLAKENDANETDIADSVGSSTNVSAESNVSASVALENESENTTVEANANVSVNSTLNTSA